jgi:TPR repeat protein
MMGICKEEGHGTSIDLAAAAAWYEKAAVQDYAFAQLNLGVLLYNGGGGVSRDVLKAYYWLKKAADKGNEKARFNLSVMADDARKGAWPDSVYQAIEAQSAVPNNPWIGLGIPSASQRRDTLIYQRKPITTLGRPTGGYTTTIQRRPGR